MIAVAGLLLAISLLSLSDCVHIFVAGAPPNFLVLYVDDWGWGDLGANWPATRETPNLDKLARRGMLLSDMHTAISVCTPSRASLMTGRLPLRTGVTTNFAPDSLYGLPLTELTLPQLLRDGAGYRSYAVGKWHLGHASGYSPTYRGFDEYTGVPYSLDMGCVDCFNVNLPAAAPCPFDPSNASLPSPALPVYVSTAPNCSGHASCDADIAAQPVDLTTLASFYAAAATGFIGQHAPSGPHAGVPFFLYWTHKSPRNTTFGDTLMELDDTVRIILDALNASGLADETLVLVTGDNGPWNAKCDLAGSQGPFTGAWQQTHGGGGGTGKFTVWEGGHREVGIAAWPGRIPAGVVSGATLSTLDVLPTLLALAGVPLPSDRHFDGVDISDVLFKNASAAPNREYLFHPNGGSGVSGELDAARYRNFKAIWSTAGAQGCSGPVGGPQKHDPPLIFDLDADPAESTPLANPPQALVDGFNAALAAKLADIAATMRSHANWTTNGAEAWPCCNRAHVGCRCEG